MQLSFNRLFGLFKKRFLYLIAIAVMSAIIGISCSDSLTSPGYGGGYYSGNSGGIGGSGGGGNSGGSGGGNSGSSNSGGSNSGGEGGGSSIGGFIDSVPTASGNTVTASDIIPINRIRMYDIYPYLKNDNDFKQDGLTESEENSWKSFLKTSNISIKLNTTDNKIYFLRDYIDIFTNATWKKASDGSFQISKVYKYSDNYYDKVFVKMSFREHYANTHWWIWNYGEIEYTFARKYSGLDKTGKYRDWSYIYTLKSEPFHFGTNTHLK